MKKTKIIMYGGIADKFGSDYEFFVSSAKEAIQALRANLKGFDSFLRNSTKGGKHYQIIIDGKLVEDSADFMSGITAEVIEIVPVFLGAGFWSSIGLIVVGAALMFFTAGAVGIFASFLGNLGLGLVVAGVASLLYTAPDVQGATSNTNAGANSYFFGGRTNTARQGGVVPVGYGRLKVGSVVVSSSVINQDLSL